MVSILKKAFPARFLMARSTKAPIAGTVVDRMLFVGDDLLYLPPKDQVGSFMDVR